jgi:hypothetical protein
MASPTCHGHALPDLLNPKKCDAKKNVDRNRK